MAEVSGPQARLRRDLERRQGFRFQVRLEVRFALPGSQKPPCEAELVNIGMDGARVDLPEALSLGAAIVLHLVANDGKTLELHGRIACSQVEAERGVWRAGITFYPVDAKTTKALFEFIVALA